jgi:signal transduction histidine kinase
VSVAPPAPAATLIQSFKQVAVDRGEVSIRSVDRIDWMQSLVQRLSPVTRRHGVRVDTSVPSGPRLVLAAGELGQVLTNLLVKACVHGFPGAGAPGLRPAATVRPGA